MVEGVLTKCHDAPERRKKVVEFALKEWAALLALVGARAVLRRRAPHGGSHIGVVEPESVGAARRNGRRGESGAVERLIEPVARPVAGEHASGPVRAVGGGGEAHDEQAGEGIAESRNRAAPVFLIPVGGPLGIGHCLPPGYEPKAGTAARDLALEGMQRCRGWRPISHPELPAVPLAFLIVWLWRLVGPVPLQDAGGEHGLAQPQGSPDPPGRHPGSPVRCSGSCGPVRLFSVDRPVVVQPEEKKAMAQLDFLDAPSIR